MLVTALRSPQSTGGHTCSNRDLALMGNCRPSTEQHVEGQGGSRPRGPCPPLPASPQTAASARRLRWAGRCPGPALAGASPATPHTPWRRGWPSSRGRGLQGRDRSAPRALQPLGYQGQPLASSRWYHLTPDSMRVGNHHPQRSRPLSPSFCLPEGLPALVLPLSCHLPQSSHGTLSTQT